jgi:hypothetical protein
MSIVNVQDFIQYVTTSCKNGEVLWILGADTRACLHATRLYINDPANLTEVSKMFSLYQQARSGVPEMAKAMAIDWSAVLAQLEALGSSVAQQALALLIKILSGQVVAHAQTCEPGCEDCGKHLDAAICHQVHALAEAIQARDCASS